MKKILSLLGIFILVTSLMFTLTAEANSFREVKVVNGSSLVIKASATTNSATVATLRRGDFVTVFSKANGWASIQAGAKKGFVNASFLATPPSVIKIASSKGGLVVKETPSRGAKTLATLQYNMIVEDFSSVGGGWSFVQYGNVTGYVASTFIGVPKTTTKTTKEVVSLRNIASPSGAVKTTLPAGTKVTIHSTIAGWAYISNGKNRGYVEAAKLFTPTTNTIANVQNYLPACPKTYTYHSISIEDGDREEDYYTAQCKFQNGGRWIQSNNDDASVMHYSLKGTEMQIGYYEGHDLYKFPLTVGKSWTYIPYVEDKETKYVMGLNEVVTTPAGTFFQVIKIRTQTKYGTTYEYLAPNLGVIKREGKFEYDGEIYQYMWELYQIR